MERNKNILGLLEFRFCENSKFKNHLSLNLNNKKITSVKYEWEKKTTPYGETSECDYNYLKASIFKTAMRNIIGEYYFDFLKSKNHNEYFNNDMEFLISTLSDMGYKITSLMRKSRSTSKKWREQYLIS